MDVTTSDILFIVMESILIPTTVFGNLLVILIVAKSKTLRKPGDVMVMFLAFADFTMGVAVLPFDLYSVIATKFYNKSIPCFLMPFLWALTLTTSVQCLFLIAIEVFFSIVHPMKHLNLASNRIAIYGGVVSWIVGFSFATVAMVVRNSYQNEILCSLSPNITTVFNVIYAAVLVLLTVYLYWRVYMFATKRRIFPYGNTTIRPRVRDIRKAKIMAIVFFSIFIFWSPFFCYFFYSALFGHPVHIVGLFKYLVMLAGSNSAFNCIVYLCKRTEFRKIVFEFFKKRNSQEENNTAWTVKRIPVTKSLEPRLASSLN